MTTTFKLRGDRSVVVATDYHWLPIDRSTPIGAKLQLLGRGGVAIYGAYSTRDDFFTHWAPVPKRAPHGALVVRGHAGEQGHRMNADGSVVVATDYFWLPIDNSTPIGAKLQLLGQGGVAVYGAYSTRDTFFTHWAPVPKRVQAARA